MVAANIEDLAALYRTLERSMNNADEIITTIDASYAQASEEWKSAGQAQFETDWNSLKPSLTRLVQVFASAGSDVAFQHNHFKIGGKEVGVTDLPPLTSPR